MKKAKKHIINRKPSAQGDMVIVPIKRLPAGATEVKPVNGEFIVAHSETGHHHVASGSDMKYFVDTNSNGMLAYMVHTKPITLRHLRDHDTHDTHEFRGKTGTQSVWEIHRQRETSPEGYRRVED